MLGRLRMTKEEALKAYNSIAGSIFSQKNKKWATQDGTFKATTLEVCKANLIRLHPPSSSTRTMSFRRLLRPVGHSTSPSLPPHIKLIQLIIPAGNCAHDRIPRLIRLHPRTPTSLRRGDTAPCPSSLSHPHPSPPFSSWRC